ncbi:MAG: SDR family NAD(P)-dependent oxidoreductase [Bacteroidales bacterium]|nr:SDR family NAD(P)-dependent oxidoreductase [Bacteroidales bacterium]
MIALITGASAGIGAAAAERFARGGYDLIVTGRRASLLEDLRKKIESAYPIRVWTLSFDVRNQEEVTHYFSLLPAEWREVDVLVNNAGLAVGLQSIQEGMIDDWERMIDTNIKGLLYVTRMVAPWMVSRQKGHIVNIGSIAGKEVYPNGNVYCATKHAVDALSKAMRYDLLSSGIRVSQICPGAAETEFSEVRFKGDLERAANVYKGFESLRATDIAEAIWYVTQLPPHVNINDMVIMPTAQAGTMLLHRT